MQLINFLITIVLYVVFFSVFLYFIIFIFKNWNFSAKYVVKFDKEGIILTKAYYQELKYDNTSKKIEEMEKKLKTNFENGSITFDEYEKQLIKYSNEAGIEFTPDMIRDKVVIPYSDIESWMSKEETVKATFTYATKNTLEINIKGLPNKLIIEDRLNDDRYYSDVTYARKNLNKYAKEKRILI